MFIPPTSNLHFLASFQYTIFARLSCLLLYSFCASSLQPLTIWSLLWSAFLHTLHKEFPWLLSFFALTRFVLILWFWTDHVELSPSNLLILFGGKGDLFKILEASKPSILSALASLHLSYLALSPPSITPQFREHTLPNLLLLAQHNPQSISNLFPLLICLHLT